MLYVLWQPFIESVSYTQTDHSWNKTFSLSTCYNLISAPIFANWFGCMAFQIKVCVWDRKRERKRQSEKEGVKRERMCVCVFVCERERGRERERVSERSKFSADE